jgi:acetyl-CoA acetyltransferase
MRAGPAEAERYERDVAFVGAARMRVSERSSRSWTTRAFETSRRALRDAGLTWTEIDGVCVHAGSTGLPGLSAGGVRGLLQAAGLRPTWHSGATECSGETGSLVPAMLAVSAGLCDHVLCLDVRGGDGKASFPAGARAAAYRFLASGPAARKALDWVAVAARRHAERDGNPPTGRNPELDDHISSETAGPGLGALDLAPSRSGATALVISSARLIRSDQRPVWVDAVGTEAPGSGLADSYVAGTCGPAAHLWRRATITPADIDLAVVDDRCTFDVLTQVEALRLCPPGGAADFVRGAVRIGPGGELPVNPHGGQLAAGDPGGYRLLHEAVVQLRGEAGRRQVTGAKVAAVSSLGRPGSGMATLMSAQQSGRI